MCLTAAGLLLGSLELFFELELFPQAEILHAKSNSRKILFIFTSYIKI